MKTSRVIATTLFLFAISLGAKVQAQEAPFGMQR